MSVRTDRLHKQPAIVYGSYVSSARRKRSIHTPRTSWSGRYNHVHGRAFSVFFRVAAAGLVMMKPDAARTDGLKRRVRLPLPPLRRPIESEYGEHLRAKTAPPAATVRTKTAAYSLQSRAGCGLVSTRTIDPRRRQRLLRGGRIADLKFAGGHGIYCP